MANNVEIILSTKDAETVRAWQRYRNNIAAVDTELKKLGNSQLKNAQAAKAHDSALGGIANKIVGIAAGWMSASTAVGFYLKSVKESIQDMETAADAQDAMTRRFQGTAGIKALQAEKATDNINQVAKDTATNPEQAFGAATSLVSTGFSPEEAQGPALEAALKLIKAQQLKGKNVDIGDLAEAAAKYLGSQGEEKTGANLKELAVAIQGLVETPMKITDLKELAKEGAGLKGKMSMKEQLATFAMLMNSLSAEEAATGMRNVTSAMATFGGSKDQTEALKEMGLTPEDVDGIGESQSEALGKIQGGLDKVAPERRAILKEKLFYKANVAAFELMAGNQDTVKRYMGMEGNVAGFDEAANIGSTGRNAAKERLTQEKKTGDAKEGKDTQHENTRLAYENVLREKGLSAVARKLKLAQFDLLTNTGLLTPEQGVRYTAPRRDDFGTNEDYVDAVKEKLEEANDPEAYRKKQIAKFESAARRDRRANGGEADNIPIPNYGAPATPREGASAEEKERFQSSLKPTINVTVNTSVVMPGGAAPAKPVPAANIGK